jgi:hypothetical protein
MTEVSKDFEIPEGLSKLGRNAAETIVKTARHRMGADASGGGCRAFYTPEEWKERGESYGLTAKLIVVHDGRCASKDRLLLRNVYLLVQRCLRNLN